MRTIIESTAGRGINANWRLRTARPGGVTVHRPPPLAVRLAGQKTGLLCPGRGYRPGHLPPGSAGPPQERSVAGVRQAQGLPDHRGVAADARPVSPPVTGTGLA